MTYRYIAFLQLYILFYLFLNKRTTFNISNYKSQLALIQSNLTLIYHLQCIFFIIKHNEKKKTKKKQH